MLGLGMCQENIVKDYNRITIWKVATVLQIDKQNWAKNKYFGYNSENESA